MPAPAGKLEAKDGDVREIFRGAQLSYRGDERVIGADCFDKKDFPLLAEAGKKLLWSLPNPVPTKVTMHDEGKVCRTIPLRRVPISFWASCFVDSGGVSTLERRRIGMCIQGFLICYCFRFHRWVRHTFVFLLIAWLAFRLLEALLRCLQEPVRMFNSTNALSPIGCSAQNQRKPLVNKAQRRCRRLQHVVIFASKNRCKWRRKMGDERSRTRHKNTLSRRRCDLFSCAIAWLGNTALRGIEADKRDAFSLRSSLVEQNNLWHGRKRRTKF